MKCKRSELLAVFDAVAPGLASRDMLANSQSFVFYDERLFTYNDKVAVSIGMPAGWEFEGAVKASELHRVMRKMDSEDVDVASDGTTLAFTCGRTKVEVKTESEYVRHHETMGFPEKWATLPPTVMDAIRRASMCAGRSLSRPLLMFVHVKGDEVRATDNHRLLVNTVKNGKMPEFLVPAGVVSDLVTFGCTHVGRTEGWLHFKAPSGVVFSTRTLDPKGYPDFSALLEVEGNEFSFPTELSAGLQRAKEALDPKEIQPVVELETHNGILQLTASGPFAVVKERYKVAFKEDMSFCINPNLLADALKLAVTAVVSEKRIRLANEEKGFVHIVGLLAKTENTVSADTPPAEGTGKAKKGKAKAPPVTAPVGEDAW